MREVKDAWKISSDHKFGEAFDKDLQDKKRQTKLEDKEKKRKEEKKQKKIAK